MFKVSSIHKYFLLLLIFKNITNNQGTQMFRLTDSVHNIRNNNLNLICPQYRTTLFRNSLFYFGPQLWNTLPNEIKIIVTTGNIVIFKREIKRYIFSMQH